MPFKKGDPNINRKGAPHKERALTNLLEKAGNKTFLINGKNIAGKRILSQVLWELAVYGRAELPGDEKKVILRITSAKEWLDIAKQIYGQIDGAPKGELDLTSNGNELMIRYVNDWRNNTPESS